MKFKKLNEAGVTHWIALVVFVMLFAAVGYRVITASHADAPSALITDASIKTPSSLSLTDASATEAALTWSPSKTTGATYNILRNGKIVGSTDSYTTNYLDTGLSPGTTYSYTLESQVGAKVSKPSSAMSVTTGATTTPISSCGASIASNSNYILTANINETLPSNNNLFCFNAQSVSHISLDCQGHSITINGSDTVLINGPSVSNSLITNCTLNDTQPNSSYDVFNLNSATNDVIENNTIGSKYSLYNNSSIGGDNMSSDLIVSHNNFINSCYTQTQANNNYIGFNNISYQNPVIGEGLASQQGSNNTIDNNTIVGNSTNGAYDVGLDSGITIGEESPSIVETNDTIANNNISDLFDAGIEVAGAINDSTITNNTITNAYTAGIGAYWYTSWKNNIVSGNTLSFTNDEPTQPGASLLDFFETVLIPAGTKVYFQNNKFIGNVFNPPASTDSGGATIDFTPTPPAPPGSDKQFISGKNTLSDNNFGVGPNQYSPAFNPTSMIIDGGGNICSNNTGTTPPRTIGIVCNK